MCENMIKKIEEKAIFNLLPFTTPDVQYILCEAQKSYIRFGEENNMNVLTDLIISRIQNDEKSYTKRVIDNAILVTCDLTANQMNCLSVLFLLTSVKICTISTVENLKDFLEEISNVLEMKKINYRKEISFLSFKGCLMLTLPEIPEILAKTYNFTSEEVSRILPDELKCFTSDYGISEIGKAIAIVNAEQKLRWRFDIHTWIKE